MTQTRPVKALLIAHEDSSGGGFVSERLEQRGLEVHLHVVVPQIDRPDLPAPFPDRNNFDLLVVLGSAWAVYDTDTIGEWIDEEIELIRSAHEAAQPVLGICFGGQALAAALGGSVAKADTTELGWFEIESTGGRLPISAGPWLEWHHDRFTPPPGAEVLARTDAAPQLFRVGNSVGTQFHPEINTPLVQEWLTFAPVEYLAEHGWTREQIAADVASHEDQNRINCFQLVDWFLDDISGLTNVTTVTASAGQPT